MSYTKFVIDYAGRRVEQVVLIGCAKVGSNVVFLPRRKHGRVHHRKSAKVLEFNRAAPAPQRLK